MENLQVRNALATVNRLIPLVEESERHLKSARTWSFIDMIGGGFVTDLVKHYKLGRARDVMDEVSFLMQELQRQLGGIQFPSDYRMRLGGFSTFADFFFDGIFADAYMAGKIFNSLDQVRSLKEKLFELRRRLSEIS